MMKPLEKSSEFALYQHGNSDTFIVSTPESRSITNDTKVAGLNYTSLLRKACAKSLRALKAHKIINLKEHEATVFHILRGGLNFGLREALGEALGFNEHSSAFISAQRARKNPQSNDWFITESDYRKISLKQSNQIVFGDVVATGTSLEYALKRIIEESITHKVKITELIFFTIGGSRSHEILQRVTEDQGIRPVVVYFEGIFGVAAENSPLSIKLSGTDLLRSPAIVAPEFLDSQYSNPIFPLERCTIYDAGSRSFDPLHYFADVRDYWQQVLAKVKQGMSFREYLAERMPEIDPLRFGDVHFTNIVQRHLEQLPYNAALTPTFHHE